MDITIIDHTLSTMASHHSPFSLPVQSNNGDTTAQQEQDVVPQEQDIVMQSVEPEIIMDQYEVL